jgi:hypothetical protein
MCWKTVGDEEMKLLPKVSEGMERVYYRCKHCKQVQAHDFVPYSLGTNSVQWNACMCQLTGHNTHLLEKITAEEFYEELK